MFWMGGLVALATALAKSGFIAWIAKIIGTAIAAANLGFRIASLYRYHPYLHILTIASRPLQLVFPPCMQHSSLLLQPAVFRVC